MQIITRSTWGARFARGFAQAPLPAREVWLHHTAMRPPAAGATLAIDASECRVIEQVGQTRFGGGISYTFVVMPSGRVLEGHGIDRRGAHTGGRNSIARAIVLHGDYSTSPPTSAQQAAVVELLRWGKAQGWWPGYLAGGHRDAPGASTACPGNAAHALIPHLNQLATASGSTAGRPAGGSSMNGAPELDATERKILNDIATGVAAMKPGWVLDARSDNCRSDGDDEFGATLHAWAEAADSRAIGQHIVALLTEQGDRITALEQRLAGGGGMDPQTFADQVSNALARRLAGA